MAKNETLEEIRVARVLGRRHAQETITKMQDLLKATSSCLEKSEVFPLYVVDIEERMRALSAFAVKDAALATLASTVSARSRRRRGARSKR